MMERSERGESEVEEEKTYSGKKKVKAGDEDESKIVLRDQKAKLITFEMISVARFSIT